MTKIRPTLPAKRFSYGALWGATSYSQWGSHYIPTDGSGTTPYTLYANSSPPYNPYSAEMTSGTSNQQAYLTGTNRTSSTWEVLLFVDTNAAFAYPTELQTLGAGNTQLDDWKRTYVDLFDSLGINWVAQIAVLMSDTRFTWQTPGYDASYYTGTPSSYEAALGPVLDFLESSACNTHFIGYTFEGIHTNALQWLHDRTNYWIIGETSNWTDLDYTSSHVPFLNGTDSGGNALNPQPTPLDRCALLDELSLEFYLAYQFLEVLEFIPQVATEYPDLPIGLNIDHVCRAATVDGTNSSPYSSSWTWWVWPGVGQPTNRCYWEKLGCLQRVNLLRENFGAFDVMTYMTGGSTYPQGGPNTFDLTWFLDWFDTLYIINNSQDVPISVSLV